jgi:inhibitor of KinA
VKAALRDLPDAAELPSRRVEVPVCYDEDLAPDLRDVARHVGLSADEVVRLHAGATYVVRFLGFSPGFPYLAGLPERLAMPRLERPRVRVPAGSVAIAGGQAGVYPQATPGGWRVVGRTPLRLFDADREPPALLRMGDLVRFVPVPRARFDALAASSA